MTIEQIQEHFGMHPRNMVGLLCMVSDPGGGPARELFLVGFLTDEHGDVCCCVGEAGGFWLEVVHPSRVSLDLEDT